VRIFELTAPGFAVSGFGGFFVARFSASANRHLLSYSCRAGGINCQPAS
jgi:hypothetical protein